MRDRPWEQAFHKNLAEEVQRRAGLDSSFLLSLAERRFNQGDESYGESSFLTDGRNLITELQSENSDAVNYIMMELQRMITVEDDNPRVINHLFEAAIYSCIAAAHAQMAQVARKEC